MDKDTKSSSLEGLKVIELASVLAGPSAGMFLAELGARVIKVERPPAPSVGDGKKQQQGGDVTRHWKMPIEPTDGISAYYASANWGKEVIFMDVVKEAGQLDVLLADADILLTNFKNSSARKLGLDAATTREKYPSLIHAHLCGYRDSDRPAYDLVVQAESGFMSMNGSPLGPPTKMPVALMDVIAGHQLKEAILLALLKRAQNGRGAYVEVSLYEAALSGLANQASNYLMNDHIPGRTGGLHPNIAPYGEQFETEDGKMICLAVGSDPQFYRLCEILEIRELALNPLFAQNTERVRNRQLLQAQLAELVRKHRSDELLAQCRRFNIPAGAVRNLQEVFEDESSREMILESEMEGRQTRVVRNTAFSLHQ